MIINSNVSQSISNIDKVCSSMEAMVSIIELTEDHYIVEISKSTQYKPTIRLTFTSVDVISFDYLNNIISKM